MSESRGVISQTLSNYLLYKMLGSKAVLPQAREPDVVYFVEQVEYEHTFTWNDPDTGEEIEEGYIVTPKHVRCGCSIGYYVLPDEIRDPEETPIRVKIDAIRPPVVTKCEQHPHLRMSVVFPDPGWIEIEASSHVGERRQDA